MPKVELSREECRDLAWLAKQKAAGHRWSATQTTIPHLGMRHLSIAKHEEAATKWRATEAKLRAAAEEESSDLRTP